jgi:nucleoside permease NupC
MELPPLFSDMKKTLFERTLLVVTAALTNFASFPSLASLTTLSIAFTLATRRRKNILNILSFQFFSSLLEVCILFSFYFLLYLLIEQFTPSEQRPQPSAP